MTGRRTDGPRHALRRRLDAARGDSGVGVVGRTGTGRAGRATARTGADRGMTSIEFVFLTPVLFFMIFATVQFGMYFFAEHVAQAAAQAGARKARAEAHDNPGRWEDDARTTTAGYIDQLGPNLLDGRTITALNPDPATVGIRVTADVPAVFPGLHFSVHEMSQGPVECFVDDAEDRATTCQGG
ncbi:TadE family protein [Streptomyces sp. NBC_01190]|uniref:TadE family protein n=1 Tax=Streptomyces sp. NBC_01190 TaxID=2903767 RepID=UPI003862F7FA